MTTPRFTRAEYQALPEGFPCELVEGELVKEPSPEYHHQRVELKIVSRLVALIGDERVVIAPADVELDEWNVLQPDVAVFDAPLDPHTRRLPIPAVVFEVLSPSTARRDRVRKTRLYLAAGVREVWLVQPSSGAVEVHTPDGVAKHAPHEEVASSALPGFRVTGAALVR